MRSKPIRSNVTIVLFCAFFLPKWRHAQCIMTSSIILSPSILNIWRRGRLTALQSHHCYMGVIPCRTACLAQVCALKLMTAQYDRIACIELLLLPTSIQSGGWILHFLLCFRNIATHRGTSVGSDALNGPMSPWIEKQQYDPWRVYTLKCLLLYVRIISLHINHSLKPTNKAYPDQINFVLREVRQDRYFFLFCNEFDFWRIH